MTPLTISGATLQAAPPGVVYVGSFAKGPFLVLQYTDRVNVLNRYFNDQGAEVFRETLLLSYWERLWSHK